MISSVGSGLKPVLNAQYDDLEKPGGGGGNGTDKPINGDTGTRGHPRQDVIETASFGVSGDPHLWQTRKGDCQIASLEDQNRILTAYAKQLLTGSIERPPKGNIHPFQAKHLNLDFRMKSLHQQKMILAEGKKALRKLHCFTSAAGLWSRGGGFPKALVPYNLKACLEEGDEAPLRKAAEIMKAKTNRDVLFWEEKSVPDGSGTYEEREAVVAQEIVEKHRKIIHEIVGRAAQKPQAINALDLKFAFGGTNTAIANSYVPLTVWTSDHTQLQVFDAHAGLEAGAYKRKAYPVSAKHKDTLLGAQKDFWNGAHAAKDGHILAYQREFYPLDPNKPRFLTDKTRIGEGAGRWLSVLTVTGRRLQLGPSVTLHQFQNIESIGDPRLEAGGHVVAQRELERELKGEYDPKSQMSVVLVPQPFIGGNPYMVERHEGRKHRLRREIHEQSSLPKVLRDQPVEFFNANNVFEEGVEDNSEPGWESKNQGTEIRVKVNVADPTQEYDAAMIGGRMGYEYEDFKWIDDYLDKGEVYLRRVGQVLERECETIRRGYAKARGHSGESMEYT